MAKVIELPYTPRKIFEPFHDRAERFSCLVAHRRAGKTVAVINDQVRKCLMTPRKNVRTGYIAPLRTQSKAIAWDYAKEFTAPIPGIAVNESELRIDFPNGARWRAFGADNYDAMRGLYFDDVALDEPADFPINAWPTVIRPALSDRKGSATFIGTPKGKNGFYDTYNEAKDDPAWFCAMHKASETGILDEDELVSALKIMGRDRYEQEYECSFEAAIQGAYYAEEMRQVIEEKRITRVPYEPTLQVHTAWDLGIGDSTAIWFMQVAGAEKRIIDYYEASGVGLDHYANMMRDKGYFYGTHILPHDARVKELGSGKSRIETLATFGIRDVYIAPMLRVDDGIQATRLFLRTCYFDEEKTKRGVEALKQYRRDFDEKGKTWRARPLHDWTSHAADAFRYLATGEVGAADWGGPLKRNLKGVA